MSKRIFIVILSVVLLGLACNKNNDSPENAYTGVWTLTETYLSPAGPVEWQPVSDKNRLLEIDIAGGKYTLGNGIWVAGAGAGKVELRSDSTIWLLPAEMKDYVLRGKLNMSKDTLELWGFCIEGCGYRFVRGRLQ